MLRVEMSFCLLRERRKKLQREMVVLPNSLRYHLSLASPGAGWSAVKVESQRSSDASVINHPPDHSR